jgi:hypothetical protein
MNGLASAHDRGPAGTSAEGMAIRVREESRTMQKIIAATGTKLD